MFSLSAISLWTALSGIHRAQGRVGDRSVRAPRRLAPRRSFSRHHRRGVAGTGPAPDAGARGGDPAGDAARQPARQDPLPPRAVRLEGGGTPGAPGAGLAFRRRGHLGKGPAVPRPRARRDGGGDGREAAPAPRPGVRRGADDRRLRHLRPAEPRAARDEHPGDSRRPRDVARPRAPDPADGCGRPASLRALLARDPPGRRVRHAATAEGGGTTRGTRRRCDRIHHPTFRTRRPPMLERERWEIDGSRSTLTFALRHFVVGEIKGDVRTLGRRADARPGATSFARRCRFGSTSPASTRDRRSATPTSALQSSSTSRASRAPSSAARASRCARTATRSFRGAWTSTGSRATST